MTVQYGEGWFDRLHVEITPLSSAAVGVYVPVPFTQRVCLCKWSRATGADIDFRRVERDGDDSGE